MIRRGRPDRVLWKERERELVPRKEQARTFLQANVPSRMFVPSRTRSFFFLRARVPVRAGIFKYQGRPWTSAEIYQRGSHTHLAPRLRRRRKERPMATA